ncbi:hypothetical protein ABPG74_021517 [Tetrahymena malaccensis]
MIRESSKQSSQSIQGSHNSIYIFQSKKSAKTLSKSANICISSRTDNISSSLISANTSYKNQGTGENKDSKKQQQQQYMKNIKKQQGPQSQAKIIQNVSSHILSMKKGDKKTSFIKKITYKLLKKI